MNDEMGTAVFAAVSCPECNEQFSVAVVIMDTADGGYTAKIINPIGDETFEGLLSQAVGQHINEQLLGASHASLDHMHVAPSVRPFDPAEGPPLADVEDAGSGSED